MKTLLATLLLVSACLSEVEAPAVEGQPQEITYKCGQISGLQPPPWNGGFPNAQIQCTSCWEAARKVLNNAKNISCAWGNGNGLCTDTVNSVGSEQGYNYEGNSGYPYATSRLFGSNTVNRRMTCLNNTWLSDPHNSFPQTSGSYQVQAVRTDSAANWIGNVGNCEYNINTWVTTYCEPF